MPVPLTQDDLNHYGDLLVEIRTRVEHAVTLLDGVTLRFNLEAAALQLRMAIELVALSTLVINRQNLAEIETALGRHKWSDAMRLVERVNPNYWPEPFVPRVDGKMSQLDQLAGHYLTKEDAGRAWSRLSELLHATNPFGTDRVDDTVVSRLRAIVSDLTQLLGFHTVDLGGREHLILATMDEPGTGAVFAEVLNGRPSPEDGARRSSEGS